MTRRQINPDPPPDLADAITVTRFWSLVERGPGCWTWMGDVDRNGYGCFFWKGRMRGAHTLALSFSTGEERTEGLDTCHSCDNRICVNPSHLRFDTRLSNVADMHNRGRAPRGGKLSASQVEVLRIRRANGARLKDLARDFGISASQASNITKGHAYRNDPGPTEKPRAQYRKGA